MHEQAAIDEGRILDWGKTAEDYARFRPGPPASFYEKLRALGIGLPDQRMLDLGTGTGALARTFAKNGATVSATDITPEQIRMAQTLADKQGLTIEFRAAPAEEQPFKDGSFDVITANQCWLYFDTARVVAEVKRLLKPAGVLVTSHFCWLPRLDRIAKASEDLILKHNPQWSGADYSGEIPAFPAWAEGHFKLKGMFYHDEPIPFTRETWRGRIRACRGVGATLSAKEVELFDQEHDALLQNQADNEFAILHRMDAHIFALNR